MHAPSSHLRVEDLIVALRDFGRYLLSRYKLFLAVILITSMLGLGWSLLQAPRYAGVTTFILEEKGSGGGLEGLASQFGFDIGSIFGGGSGILSGDNILDIMRSKQIVYNVLQTKVDFANGKDTITLADHYLDIMDWRSKYPSMRNLYFYQNSANVNPLRDSVLQLMHEKLIDKQLSVTRLNKKGSIIQVQMLSPSQHFSKLFTERLYHETFRFYIGVKTGTSKSNIERLEQRADSLSRILNQRSYQAAGMQILDANAAYRSSTVPVELTNREKVLVFELYAEVIKNLEIARIMLVNQTPVLQVLDRPAYPLKQDNWPWWKWILAGGTLGFILVFALLFYTYPGTNRPDTAN